jgi:hypothetical protein
MLTHLEEHELVERIIPLHEVEVGGGGPAEVLVAVVGVTCHAAAQRALRVRYLRGLKRGLMRGIKSNEPKACKLNLCLETETSGYRTPE